MTHDIHAIGHKIQQHVNEHWQTIFKACHPEMIAQYDEMGDTVYGMYGERLFKYSHDQLKEAGLRATPRLPGNFGISREWGPEDLRQRWMWSKIITTDREPIGTIVTVFYHNHLVLDIPRPFDIIALTETSKRDVVKALSTRSTDFAQALEARIEYAEYYK